MRQYSPAASDPRLTSLRDILERRAEPASLSPPPVGDRAHAAVSLILRMGPELEVLLIRRAEFAEDPWSGHMALPGGRRDPRDPDLLATAIRETMEETGVDLHAASTPLGALAPVAPNTTRIPPISVHPFVFGVAEETTASAASGEVDEVIWTPLHALQSPEAAGTVTIRYGDGGSRSFPCIRVEERVIWGLTYRILTGFMTTLRAHAPELLTGP